MGGGSSYHERPLSNEEKQLYAQQTKYMQTIQPAIEKMVSTGLNNLNYVYTPDWNSMASNYTDELNNIISSNKDLTNGVLPSAYTSAKQNYYNNLYENTMGKGMANLAKSGVINSSRFNTTAKDWQGTLSDQMSKDYSTDMNLQNTLLNSRYNYLNGGLNANINMNNSSRENATDYFKAATGAQSSNTSALSAISNNENNRGYVTQDGAGFFGGLLGAASAASAYSGSRRP